MLPIPEDGLMLELPKQRGGSSAFAEDRLVHECTTVALLTSKLIDIIFGRQTIVFWEHLLVHSEVNSRLTAVDGHGNNSCHAL